MLFISTILQTDARDIVIPDAMCFEKYTSDLYKLGNELTREMRTDYHNQLIAMENALGIQTPEQGYSFPLAMPLCSLMDPPSNYTLATYNIVNKLHMERIRTQLINNRVLFRLMMIQKRILETRRSQ
jgi:hypothetical protein